VTFWVVYLIDSVVYTHFLCDILQARGAAGFFRLLVLSSIAVTPIRHIQKADRMLLFRKNYIATYRISGNMTEID
jgi:hypothetical protein